MKFRVAAWLVALGPLFVGLTLVSLTLVSLTERRAYAQTSGTSGTSTSGGASVTAALLNPTRLIGGNTQTLRSQNLNPEGISYSDCTSDMTLEFSISLNSFVSGSSLWAWAGKTGDCNSTGARGNGAVPVCWPLLPSSGSVKAAIMTSAVITLTVDIRVQDLIAQMNSPSMNYVRGTAATCSTVQQSFASVPLTIWFLPVDSTGTDNGTAYSYPITVDLVGPPAPGGLGETVGDTLFNISWSPNTDSDTAGYDIYIDPIPGSADASLTLMGDGSVNTYVCDEGGVTTAVGDDESDGATDGATDDGAADGAVDATTTTGPALDCHYTTAANNSSSSSSSSASNNCNGVSVFGGTVVDGGTIVQTDEAGNTTTESGSGGISTVPSANLVGINAGFTVASPTSSQYTITGLTNNVHYHVSVSAVDAFGNIGPPAAEVCDFPAPVNDFWDNYRNDGGLAGGGFCSLGAVGIPVGPTVAFGGLGTGLLGVLRRKRRRR